MLVAYEMNTYVVTFNFHGQEQAKPGRMIHQGRTVRLVLVMIPCPASIEAIHCTSTSKKSYESQSRPDNSFFLSVMLQ